MGRHGTAVAELREWQQQVQERLLLSGAGNVPAPAAPVVNALPVTVEMVDGGKSGGESGGSNDGGGDRGLLFDWAVELDHG